jgi:hypothetical protein
MQSLRHGDAGALGAAGKQGGGNGGGCTGGERAGGDAGLGLRAGFIGARGFGKQ